MGRTEAMDNLIEQEVVIPTDYESIFRDRVVIVTGVGRSGTTILGKIIGSMEPAYYLFEPAIMKLLTPMGTPQVLRAILFEDYFLNEVHGRGNANERDWSWQCNHYSVDDIMERRATLRRRSDAMLLIEAEKPFFIIKNPEFQRLFRTVERAFPGVRFVNLIRDGLAVVSSAMERGWYTDDFCNMAMVEWMMEGEVNQPFYADAVPDDWAKWNPETRAACVWRSLMTLGDEYARSVSNTSSSRIIQFKYEVFCETPQPYIDDISNWLGLDQTALTAKHIASIKEHKPRPTPGVTLSSIEEPERGKFIKTMQDVGYL